MNLYDLLQKSISAATAIQDLVKAESRTATKSEMDSISAHLDKADELKAQIAQAEDNEKRLTELGAISAPVTAIKPVANVKVSAPEFTKDAKAGFANQQEFFRAIVSNRRVNPLASKDKRIAYLAAAGSDEQQTQNEGLGGVFVPQAFIAEQLKIDPEMDPTVGRTFGIPMSSPSVKLVARVDNNHTSSVSGGFTVSRKPETQVGTSSKQTNKNVILTANNLFGLAYSSEELLSDSAISVAAIIQNGFDSEFAAAKFNEKLNGSGSGEFQGILNSDALVVVPKEGGQAADTIVGENLVKMRSRLWGYGNAIWIANHDTFPQLAGAHIAGTNGDQAIYMPSMQIDRPDVLLGRPIFYSEFAETLGDEGDIILANWSQYLEGTLEGMQSASSIHVRFVEHESAFKFWERNDARSWWSAPLTPKKGAKTLSPFVTLAVR